MSDLMDFQRATVEHVVDRFYGPEPTRRFLVADETGLGKSLVARGVIAKLVERLQNDDDVDRIDVVYVCSNADIAAQNVARLAVTADESVSLSSRLTLLAKHTARLDSEGVDGNKPVNVVAFTPSTSFDRGWRIGKAEERAMLFLMLERARGWDGWTKHAAVRALLGPVGTPKRFADCVENLRSQLNQGIDAEISADFLRRAGEQGVLESFELLLSRIGRRTTLPQKLREECYTTISKLRSALAFAGVRRLQPELVILDEFQRFRHLLDPDGGEAAELAHHLFDFGDARVLLLSATPYKPFTLAEEAQFGEDHHRDFRRMLEFLNDDPQWNAEVARHLDAYRDALVTGADTREAVDAVATRLSRVMCRTERPGAAENSMLREIRLDADELRPSGVRGYVTLHRLARAVDAPLTIEYWKSAPYFLNFIEGYQLGDKLRAALSDPRNDLTQLLEAGQQLNPRELQRFGQIDLGNARLRRLAADTIGKGWWRLLWTPPSMPHYRLEEPFASLVSMTKRLLFSSWNATPTAVASLLSYEAERRIVTDGLSEDAATERRRITTRLDFRVDAGRPSSMSTLALFWPHPRLAELGDPLVAARQHPDEELALPDVESLIRRRIEDAAGAEARVQQPDAAPWEALLGWTGGGLPRELAASAVVEGLSGRRGGDDDSDWAVMSRNLTLHVDMAVAVTAGAGGEPCPDHLLDGLTMLAMHSPGNVAWRALRRVMDADSAVSAAGHWHAAAVLAGGLRSLFNRPESTMLLDQLEPDVTYWRAVLRYIAVGGLQAVLDEYVYQLRSIHSDRRF